MWRVLGVLMVATFLLVPAPGAPDHTPDQEAVVMGDSRTGVRALEE